MYKKYNNTQLSPGQIFLIKKNKIIILLIRSTIQTSIKLAMLKPLTVLVFSMFQKQRWHPIMHNHIQTKYPKGSNLNQRRKI
jgi:hypothetical protein